MLKKISLVILLTAGCTTVFTNVNGADQFISKTEITDVKIFTSGATVTRNAKVTVDAGQSLLRFENLSASINPSSIAVSGIGEFTILSVTHQLDYLGPNRKTEEMLQLEDSLLRLNNQREGYLNEIYVLQEEQNMLLANKSIGGANTGVKLEELKSISTYIRTRLIEIKTRLLDLTTREKKVKVEIDKVNQQLAVLNHKRNEPYSTILVTVSATARTAATFNISYYTGNVSWSPSYDIRVKDAASPVKMLFKAMVNQNTGEDWNKVKVKISTSNPSLGSTKPELYPWYLNFSYPVQIRSSAPMKRNDDAMAGQPMMEAAQAPALSNYVNTIENQLSTDYEISIPYSIPSNGLNYAVEIKDFELPATYSYYATPKLDRDAFLVAAVTGWEGLDLQPGSSNVYYENTFVGESMFNPVTTHDTMLVSLGRDKRVVVKRELMKDLSGNQLLGSNRTRNFTYEISVKNNRKEAIKITIEDQLPVSQDKDIEVKLTEGSDGELIAETGKISWKMEVLPSQQAKKKFGYSVKYPKDRQVLGL